MRIGVFYSRHYFHAYLYDIKLLVECVGDRSSEHIIGGPYMGFKPSYRCSNNGHRWNDLWPKGARAFHLNEAHVILKKGVLV